MTADELRVETDDPVCTITLSRPATLNALTYPMLSAFRTAVDDAARDPRVVGIVVTGEGRGFCSGLDASVLQATANAGSTTRPVASDDVPGLFTWLLRVPKPVIAAVNGVAAGGGFVLAAMSDVRIASTAGSFTSSSAAGQGFAALQRCDLATASPGVAACRSPRRAGRRTVGWRCRQHLRRTAAKLRRPQRTAGAAALIEKRAPSFPRLGE